MVKLFIGGMEKLIVLIKVNIKYMTLLFHYNSEEEHKELIDILITESCLHFGFDKEEFFKHKNEYYDLPSFNFTSHFGDRVKIEIANDLYFNDLENAKCNIYDGNDFIGLHDWMSDVEENLSFVPEIEVR